jgi:hypothetical protein
LLLQKWVTFMKERGCSCVAVNSHSKESIKEVVRTVLVLPQVQLVSECSDLLIEFIIIM